MSDFSSNLGLSALPEIDQDTYPEIYAELLRIRYAFEAVQSYLEVLAAGTTGQKLTKNSGTDFDISWV